MFNTMQWITIAVAMASPCYMAIIMSLRDKDWDVVLTIIPFSAIVIGIPALLLNDSSSSVFIPVIGVLGLFLAYIMVWFKDWHN